MKSSIILLALSALLTTAVCEHKKVLLTDVRALTLHKGQYTTTRRGSPVEQVKCVGGAAKNAFTLRLVQCYNRGTDGLEVQWQCTADMPTKYVFGQLSVSCEGYNYPEDPYVLAGSCGLEYKLEYNPEYKGMKAAEDSNPLFYVFLFVIVLFAMYVFIRGPASDGFGADGYRGGPGYPPAPGSGGPPPPGFTPPPPYSDTRPKPGPSTSTFSQENRPGFWTGAGLGALGGYFMGSRTAGQSYRRRQGFGSGYDNPYDQPSTSSGIYRRSPESSPESFHSSTGFGGTSRR
ncbi:hypothetical protein L596_000234 [Steinernema carpocapsae]|uniref:Store-operated calcium entry-associated regulatory factor n=1 Tax=Steinernema carpocapsae TaxID=34508 RepID=A0A4U8ULR5_STECR|nr:hypothetical protein L596_000234 [Steinernema carpocapsae]